MSGRRGLVVPQNTFLENIIKTANGVHQYFLLGSAQIMDAPIVYCSDSFIHLTGYKKNQVIRKKTNCSFMYGSLTTKDAVRQLRNALQEKISVQIEILFYKQDGTPFWVLLNVGLIKDQLDENVLFLITFQDISAFKEPINPNYRKHRWTEFNKKLHSKPVPENPISKAKEEKNRMHIGQLMDVQINALPEYKQDIPNTPRFVILHCSTPKIIWDWMILIFILYTATSVPFIVCFKFNSTAMTITDAVVDIMFLIDVVLNFHTTFVGEDGAFVFDLKKIRRTYLRSWFFVDFITSLPYGLLGFVISGAAKGVTEIIGFLKAIRLLRLNRVVRALDQYLEYGFITLILWMLFFCLCAHWMACIFYLIADHYDNFTNIGWVRAMSDATEQPLVIINNTVLRKPTLASLYMTSLYFSLTSLTSIGFGNIAPNTTAEKIFSCVTMIFGGLCYAVIFGQVTAIVQQSQRKSENYHQTLDNMRSFCQLYNVPKEISTRILDYYMYNWALNKGVDTNQVLQHCPKDLQSDICIHLNRKVIDSNPAFGELSNAVLRAIARNFAIHRVAPGERIVHEGETLDTLYFVASGSFEITQKGNVVGLVGEGDVFGDDVCRRSDIGRSVADVFALTYGDVHAIGRDELLGALSFYPEHGAQFAKVFRLSYNLRDEITMRKCSSLSRVKSHQIKKEMEIDEIYQGPKLSFIEEMQNNFDGDSTPSFDMPTPNSQNMTDTDPPSKSFAAVKKIKPRLQGSTGMKGNSEDTELDEMGTDEDLKHWDDYQDRRENCEGLLSEITGMKSEVRREIEVMGGKMNHLEENIAMILRLLKERDVPVADGPQSHLLTPSLLTCSSPGSTVSNTASIVNRARAEIPDEVTLPDWVEMGDFGMAEGVDENVAVREELKGEKEEKEEERAKLSKKSARKSQRKAKKEEASEKRKRKPESQQGDEDTVTTPRIVVEVEDSHKSGHELEDDAGHAIKETSQNVSRMSHTTDHEDGDEAAHVEDDAAAGDVRSRTEEDNRNRSHQSVRGPQDDDQSVVSSKNEGETNQSHSRQSRHEEDGAGALNIDENNRGKDSRQSSRGEKASEEMEMR